MSTRKFVVLMAMFAALAASPALCATVAGTITDVAGKQIPGIGVIVEDANAAIVATAVTGAKGEYSLSLAPGSYRFGLDPGASAFKKGGPIDETVADKGLTLNWTVSSSAEAVASAEPAAPFDLLAADPFGLTMAQFLAATMGVAAVGGGVVGGYYGAGGFGGHHHHPHPPVVSPSI